MPVLRNNFFINTFLFAALIWISPETKAAESSQVTIFVAKEIITLNASNLIVEAVAVQGSEIIKEG